MQTVIETRDGWMIRCHGCQWHEFPKQPLANGAKWTFDGNMVSPTFHPSMNSAVNQPGPHHNPRVKSSRCHFIVTAGVAHYLGDCTHEFAGQQLSLLPWPEEKIKYYESLRDAGWP